MATDDDRGLGLAHDVRRSLLEAKLAVPEPHPGSVSRRPLIGRARTSDRRFVGVTAPAGYGKTTFLAEWVAAEDRPVAWVTLDRFDNEASALLLVIACAFAATVPRQGGLIEDIQGAGSSVLGRAAPRLAAAFRSQREPFVLVLDDLHEVTSPACHDALGVAVAGLPDGAQFVSASRSAQPHLALGRTKGDALDIGAEDLALDAVGARQVFAAAQVELSSELADAVTRRTEGWPVGLYLAATIARDSPDDAITISGDDRFVADYLYAESLSRQPREMRDFLLRTSVLDHLSPSLCDAVLGRSDSATRLEDLEATHQFLVALDRGRGWYRYHSLFREFLAGELRRVSPHLVADLRRRAADWYEAHDAPVNAVEHLLETPEQERCVRLVNTHIRRTYHAGRRSIVEHWLSSLGDAAIEAYPPLAVQAGWIAALTGNTTAANRWAAVVDSASFEDVPLDGSASFASARAVLRAAMIAGGPESMLKDAAFAVTQEPSGSPLRGTADLLLAEAHLLHGDLEAARPLLDDVVARGPTTNNADNYAMAQGALALLAMEDSRWAEADERVGRALTAIADHRMEDYASSIRAFTAAARLAVHRGQTDRARRELTRAMRTRPATTAALPGLAVGARLHIARVYVSIGDPATARHLLREVDDLLRERPDLGVLVDATAAFRAAITAQNDPSGVAVSPLSPAELRVLPYLQTHLTFREIADRLCVSRNTIASQVTAIYRKLGVSSRTAAVVQATAMGLIGH